MVENVISHTSSYDSNLTDGIKNILSDVSSILLKEDHPIIVAEDEIGNYQWFIETLSLMAKQVNLCDSCMLLLENGMEQEAFILARSQFNNMLWIRYLMHDDEVHSHFKEFVYQPQLNQIRADKNLKQMLKDYENELDPALTSDYMKNQLDLRIKKNTEELNAAGINSKGTKPVKLLAQEDFELFGSYVTLYNESSKFEHSDISTTQHYRKEAAPGISKYQAFRFDMGKSDKELWYTVFQYSLQSLFQSYEAIENKILNEETQLLDISPITKNAPYSKNELQGVMYKFAIVLKLFETDTKDLKTHFFEESKKHTNVDA